MPKNTNLSNLPDCFDFRNVTKGSITVGKFVSNFDGEVEAISEVARIMLLFPGTKNCVSLRLNLGDAGHMFTHNPRMAKGGRMSKTTTTA
ncbi:hypothetical protein CEXT_619881 [Caerostris extrusa]|uniref:Uncharacterized protein n=1 Tax=Caerostris extrusa TaxID=172846 RepID=A0AAV4R508_CAEEX|nr:hypothetical protein CEXT_619881 [Caerostris extrusa]